MIWPQVASASQTGEREAYFRPTPNPTPTFYGNDVVFGPRAAQNFTASAEQQSAEWVITPGKEQAYIDQFRSSIKGIPLFTGNSGTNISQF